MSNELDGRPCEVTSHHFYLGNASFHGFTKDEHGKAFAIIEDERGVLSKYGLDFYTIRFTDRDKPSETKGE